MNNIKTSNKNKFKKSHAERTVSENIMCEALLKYELYQSGRFLGAMETVLIFEKVLEPGKKFNFNNKKEKFLFMTFNSTETYEEHIIRLSEEFLKTREVI